MTIIVTLQAEVLVLAKVELVFRSLMLMVHVKRVLRLLLSFVLDIAR